MQTNISLYSTNDLLRIRRSEDDRDLAHDAERTLFKRWDKGIDLSYLIKFIDTDVNSDRRLGAYFLLEVSPRVARVKDAVLKLAGDDLAPCRQAFVRYFTNSGWYDDKVAVGLVAAITDFDLWVRLEVIQWAILTTDDNFDDFAARVIAFPDEPEGRRRAIWDSLIRKRAVRALAIARYVRNGESVERAAELEPGEDSMILDRLSVFEPHYSRHRERR